MILTIFLSIIFCAAMTLMMFSAIAFIQNNKFFSSAPKEAREVLIPRENNIKSQLLKLLIIFPAASALVAWICSLFVK